MASVSGALDDFSHTKPENGKDINSMVMEESAVIKFDEPVALRGLENLSCIKESHIHAD